MEVSTVSNRIGRWTKYGLGSAIIGILISFALATPIQAADLTQLPQQQLHFMTRLYCQAALDLTEMGRLSESVALLKKVYAADPTNLPYVFTYADILTAQGDLAAARNVYENTLQHVSDPASKSALYYELSVIYDLENQPEKEIDVLQTALSTYPNEPKPARYYYDLGVAYAKLDQYDKTLTYSEKSVQIAPDFSAGWNNLGYSQAKLGSYTQGLANVEHALSLDPRNANTLDSLGYIQYQLKHYQQAVDAYENALRINPNMRESLLYLGKAYEALHNNQKAITAYQRCLALMNDTKQKEELTRTIAHLQSSSQMQPLQNSDSTPAILAPAIDSSVQPQQGKTGPKAQTSHDTSGSPAQSFFMIPAE